MRYRVYVCAIVLSCCNGIVAAGDVVHTFLRHLREGDSFLKKHTVFNQHCVRDIFGVYHLKLKKIFFTPQQKKFCNALHVEFFKNRAVRNFIFTYSWEFKSEAFISISYTHLITIFVYAISRVGLLNKYVSPKGEIIDSAIAKIFNPLYMSELIETYTRQELASDMPMPLLGSCIEFFHKQMRSSVITNRETQLLSFVQAVGMMHQKVRVAPGSERDAPVLAVDSSSPADKHTDGLSEDEDSLTIACDTIIGTLTARGYSRVYAISASGNRFVVSLYELIEQYLDHLLDIVPDYDYSDDIEVLSSMFLNSLTDRASRSLLHQDLLNRMKMIMMVVRGLSVLPPVTVISDECYDGMKTYYHFILNKDVVGVRSSAIKLTPDALRSFLETFYDEVKINMAPARV